MAEITQIKDDKKLSTTKPPQSAFSAQGVEYSDAQLSKVRASVIYGLVQKLDGPPKEKDDIFHPASINAALELGKMRAIEAIPALLQNLTKIGPLSMDDIFDYRTNFPCSAALIEIGEPSVEPCLRLLVTTPSTKERDILLHILVKIKGSDWVIHHLATLDEKMNPIPSRPYRDIQESLKSQKQG